MVLVVVVLLNIGLLVELVVEILILILGIMDGVKFVFVIVMVLGCFEVLVIIVLFNFDFWCK